MVFASACSGIYKSVDAGDCFTPLKDPLGRAAKRVVLKQDPLNYSVVYAGTTEGFTSRLTSATVCTDDRTRCDRERCICRSARYESCAAGHRPRRSSAERGRHPVLRCESGFFRAQGRGAVVIAVIPPLYAGVVNDKKYGGVFVSSNGGERWEQIADGLNGRDVFALAELPEGMILAGTNHGILCWSPMRQARVGARAAQFKTGWRRRPLRPSGRQHELAAKTHKATKARHGKSVPEEKPVAEPCLTNSTAFRRSSQRRRWLASTVEAFTPAGPGRELAGGPVMGWVGLSFGCRAWIPTGRCSAGGSVLSGRRPEWRFMGFGNADPDS